jgi:hypothetical protein
MGHAGGEVFDNLPEMRNCEIREMPTQPVQNFVS